MKSGIRITIISLAVLIATSLTWLKYNTAQDITKNDAVCRELEHWLDNEIAPRVKSFVNSDNFNRDRGDYNIPRGIFDKQLMLLSPEADNYAICGVSYALNPSSSTPIGFQAYGVGAFRKNYLIRVVFFNTPFPEGVRIVRTNGRVAVTEGYQIYPIGMPDQSELGIKISFTTENGLLHEEKGREESGGRQN